MEFGKYFSLISCEFWIKSTRTASESHVPRYGTPPLRGCGFRGKSPGGTTTHSEGCKPLQKIRKNHPSPTKTPNSSLVISPNPALPRRHRHIRQVLFPPNHLIDFLLKSSLRDEPPHHHVLLLADAVGPVGEGQVNCCIRPVRRLRASGNCSFKLGGNIKLSPNFTAEIG